MPPDTTPHHPNLAYQLPADAYHQLIHTLRLTLPPPPTDPRRTPGPDDLTRRDHAAIARIAALAPANAAEADLAAQFVAASEQWKDCLRLAQDAATTPDAAAKCRAQASGMMRQANSALRLLLRMQEVRGKLEADNAACDRAAWSEHRAIGLMAEALSPRPDAPPSGAPAAEPPPVPPPRAEPEPAKPPEPAPACPGPRSGVAAAEHYAILYPGRAALIRRMGRLPDNVSCGPPDKNLVRALLTDTPALAACGALVSVHDPPSRHQPNETPLRIASGKKDPCNT